MQLLGRNLSHSLKLLAGSTDLDLKRCLSVDVIFRQEGILANRVLSDKNEVLVCNREVFDDLSTEIEVSYLLNFSQERRQKQMLISIQRHSLVLQ